MAGTAAGLQAFVNDVTPLFVRDETPAAESRYDARFYVDTNGFDPGESVNHFRTRILIVSDQSARRAVTVVLRRQSGLYSLQVRVRTDDGSRADTGFFPISDGQHGVRFDWQQASAPGANDGKFVLFIDNVVKSTLTGLDTDLTAIEYVRLGAISVKGGAGGTLYFDEFESRHVAGASSSPW